MVFETRIIDQELLADLQGGDLVTNHLNYIRRNFVDHLANGLHALADITGKYFVVLIDRFIISFCHEILHLVTGQTYRKAIQRG